MNRDRAPLAELAEEYDVEAKRQVGNFPQALSHISLINAASEFTNTSSPGQQRAQLNREQPNWWSGHQQTRSSS
jgi:hypothetical protein